MKIKFVLQLALLGLITFIFGCSDPAVKTEGSDEEVSNTDSNILIDYVNTPKSKTLDVKEAVEKRQKIPGDLR